MDQVSSIGFAIGALFFSVWVILILLLTVTGERFYGAYLDHYGGPEGRRRRGGLWGKNYPMRLRDWYRPPWNMESWFRRLDDPLVERRRRQYLLAWGALLGLFLPPFTLLLIASLIRDWPFK